jgi:hypothetical protein
MGFRSRVHDWKIRLEEDIKKRWWWPFVGVPVTVVWELVKDRVVGGTNRFIDAHVSFSFLRPVVTFWQVGRITSAVYLCAGFAVFVILGLTVHAYFETRPKKGLPVHASAELLSKLANLHTPKILGRSRGLKDSDPHVFVNFLDMRNTLARRTVFELHNQGGSVAQKIVIEPVKLSAGIANFEEVDTLGKDAKHESIPQIEGVGWLYKYDFLNLVRLEVDRLGKAGDQEFFVPMIATYRDLIGTEFEVSFDFFYSPYNNLLHGESEILKKVKQFYGIRNTKIRIVSDHAAS